METPKTDPVVTFRKQAFEAFALEGESIAFRADFFLIFHAIAFEAFFAAKDRDAVIVAFVALGIAVAWLAIGARQQWLADLPAKAATMGLNTNPPDVELEFILRMSKIRASPPWHLGLVRSIPMFAIGIPALISVAWLALLLIGEHIENVSLACRVFAALAAPAFNFATFKFAKGKTNDEQAAQLVAPLQVEPDDA